MEKSKWGCDQRLRDGTNLSFERDRAYGFSWPQRNYRCSFCNKEFKSAQALGGHMNVHRRDRARMRLSPSWDSQNPNPSLPLSSHLPFTDKFLPCEMACISSVINSPSPPSLQEDDFAGGIGGRRSSPRESMALCGEDLGLKNEGTTMHFSRRNDHMTRLDLSLGLIQQVKEADSDSDLGLDLELRLGYS